ncbi:MAG TPA: SpoIIE family protein phosphatase, partial [Bacteroidia bacterium]|nr:SpoIIE family protein phosphatase [Bacteroidia bacterium]
NNITTSYDGDKQAIGLQSVDNYKPYTNHEISIQKGDVIYMFTDGFEDQFGGEKGKKYRSAHFREFLESIHINPMSKQKTLLENEFFTWKGKHEQLDDVQVIGIRF